MADAFYLDISSLDGSNLLTLLNLLKARLGPTPAHSPRQPALAPAASGAPPPALQGAQQPQHALDDASDAALVSIMRDLSQLQTSMGDRGEALQQGVEPPSTSFTPHVRDTPSYRRSPHQVVNTPWTPHGPQGGSLHASHLADSRYAPPLADSAPQPLQQGAHSADQSEHLYTTVVPPPFLSTAPAAPPQAPGGVQHMQLPYNRPAHSAAQEDNAATQGHPTPTWLRRSRGELNEGGGNHRNGSPPAPSAAPLPAEAPLASMRHKREHWTHEQDSDASYSAYSESVGRGHGSASQASEGGAGGSQDLNPPTARAKSAVRLRAEAAAQQHLQAQQRPQASKRQPSSGGTPQAARWAKSQRDVLFNVEVNVQGEHIGHVAVQRGAVPSHLAGRFVREHSLPPQYISRLTQRIAQRMEEHKATEAEQKQAEQRAASKRSRAARQRVTVPKPFKLASGSRRRRGVEQATATRHGDDGASHSSGTRATGDRSALPRRRRVATGGKSSAGGRPGEGVRRAQRAVRSVSHDTASSQASASAETALPASSIGRFIGRLHVDVGGGQGGLKATLELRLGDSPDEIVQRFAEQHGTAASVRRTVLNAVAARLAEAEKAERQRLKSAQIAPVAINFERATAGPKAADPPHAPATRRRSTGRTSAPPSPEGPARFGMFANSRDGWLASVAGGQRALERDEDSPPARPLRKAKQGNSRTRNSAGRPEPPLQAAWGGEPPPRRTTAPPSPAAAAGLADSNPVRAALAQLGISDDEEEGGGVFSNPPTLPSSSPPRSRMVGRGMGLPSQGSLSDTDSDSAAGGYQAAPAAAAAPPSTVALPAVGMTAHQAALLKYMQTQGAALPSGGSASDTSSSASDTSDSDTSDSDSDSADFKPYWVPATAAQQTQPPPTGHTAPPRRSAAPPASVVDGDMLPIIRSGASSVAGAAGEGTRVVSATPSPSMGPLPQPTALSPRHSGRGYDAGASAAPVGAPSARSAPPPFPPTSAAQRAASPPVPSYRRPISPTPATIPPPPPGMTGSPPGAQAQQHTPAALRAKRMQQQHSSGQQRRVLGGRAISAGSAPQVAGQATAPADQPAVHPAAPVTTAPQPQAGESLEEASAPPEVQPRMQLHAPSVHPPQLSAVAPLPPAPPASASTGAQPPPRAPRSEGQERQAGAVGAPPPPARRGSVPPSFKPSPSVAAPGQVQVGRPPSSPKLPERVSPPTTEPVASAHDTEDELEATPPPIWGEGGDTEAVETTDLSSLDGDEYLEATVIQSEDGGPPLLNLDLDIDDSRRGRIVICDGDDLDRLAAAFVEVHGLEGHMGGAVLQLLQANLEQHVQELMHKEAGDQDKLPPMSSVREETEERSDEGGVAAGEGGLL